MAVRSGRVPGSVFLSPEVGGFERSTPSESFDEITLVDVVRVLYKRWLVLSLAIAFSLVAGGVDVVTTAPAFEASATVVGLDQQLILHQWLSSRQAAEAVGDSLGKRLYAPLFGGEWDATAERWRTSAPSPEAIGLAVMSQVTVTIPKDGVIRVHAKLKDPVLARDVAAAYVATLDLLRPKLEELARQGFFDRYFDGTNAEEARARAEIAAREKTYWLAFDSPNLPTAPVEPRPVRTLVIAGVLGTLGGLVVVFALEWLSRYRMDFTRG